MCGRNRYHAGGQLSTKLLLLMVTEVFVQVYFVGCLFALTPGGGGEGEAERASSSRPSSATATSLLTPAQQYTLQVAGPLALAMFVVHAADLAVQRVVGAVLFLGLSCWFALYERDAQQHLGFYAVERGMRWAAPLLCFKFLISHVPRHEPYL
jgi:hypothetical protein